MATEKRLIDANALLGDDVWICGEFVGDPYDDGYVDALDAVQKVILEFPTVDAVEVVHCCDCQKCTVLNQAGYREPLLFCKHWKGNPMVDPTDFCSYGERKADG